MAAADGQCAQVADIADIQLALGGQGQAEAAIMLDDTLTEAQNTQGCLTS